MLERRAAYVGWIAWLVGLLWMLAVHLSRTLQPNYWPLLLLLTVQSLSAVVGLAFGVWHLCRGTHRLAAAGWMLLSTGPVCLWVAQLSYSICLEQGRQTDPNLIQRVSRPATLALADAVVRVLYPQRTEGRYVVMIHNGVLASPQQDVAAMDHHLEHMQETLGRRMRSKMRWVRGRLLGVSERGGFGWALGSSDTASPETEELAQLDRHEAAHAILDTLEHEDIRMPLYHDVPAVLAEGWAQLHSGYPEQTLLQRAWDERRCGPVLSLHDFTSEDWYGCHMGPAYTQGGPLVEYILHQFGPQKFFELYMTCRRASFAEDCKRVLGVSLDDLDRAYWGYVEQRTGPKRIGESYVQLTPKVDESLWREVAKGHLAAANRVRSFTSPLHAQSKVTTEYPNADPPRKAEVKYLELLVSGNRWRYEKRSRQRRDVIIADPRCSFSLDKDGTQTSTRFPQFQLNRDRIVSLAFAGLIWQHYALADGDWAVWNANSKPIVNRVERVSRNGRDLVLVAFENRSALSDYRRYASGELCFDPAYCWAIRFASLRSKREDGTTSRMDLSFKFHVRENEPPLVRSVDAISEIAGKTEHIRHSTTYYDFHPRIAVDDFSPAKYGLTLPRQGFGTGLSWYLVLSVALVCLSIAGGAMTLLVNRWFICRESQLSTSHRSVTA